MICRACVEGGTMNSYGRDELAHERHRECEYADCACQHEVGNWTIKKPPRKDNAQGS